MTLVDNKQLACLFNGADDSLRVQGYYSSKVNQFRADTILLKFPDGLFSLNGHHGVGNHRNIRSLSHDSGLSKWYADILIRLGHIVKLSGIKHFMFKKHNRIIVTDSCL